MRTTTANRLGYREEATTACGQEERYVMTADGDVLAMLPGCRQPTPEGRSLSLARGALCEGVAGAGDAPGPGGWFRYRCALIAPRRFAARCGEALISGRNAEEILREAARTALEEALRKDGSDGPRSLWPACRRRLEEALLDRGWQLRAFRPGQYHPGEGGGR